MLVIFAYIGRNRKGELDGFSFVTRKYDLEKALKENKDYFMGDVGTVTEDDPIKVYFKNGEIVKIEAVGGKFLFYKSYKVLKWEVEKGTEEEKRLLKKVLCSKGC